jgi:hypothetical protein
MVVDEIKKYYVFKYDDFFIIEDIITDKDDNIVFVYNNLVSILIISISANFLAEKNEIIFNKIKIFLNADKKITTRIKPFDSTKR